MRNLAFLLDEGMGKRPTDEFEVVFEKEELWEVIDDIPESENVATIADNPQKKILLLLMGAVTSSGDWIEELNWHSRNSVETDPIVEIHDISQGRVPFFTVITGVQKRMLARMISEDIKRVMRDNPGAEISIAAHSYGSKLIVEAVRCFDDGMFNYLFILGSIVNEKDIRKIRDKFSKIVCDCVDKDYVAYILEVISMGHFKNTSVYGIKGYNQSINRKFSGGHSELTSLAHFKCFIIPAISGRPIDQPSKFFRSTFSEHSITLLRMAILAIFVAIFYLYNF